MKMASAYATSLSRLDKEVKYLENFLTSEETAVQKLRLKEAFTLQLLTFPTFSTSTFLNSNAGDNVGWSFTDATCDMAESDYNWLMGSFFLTAITMLGNYIRKNELPTSEDEIRVLYRLVHFLMDSDEQEVIEKFKPKEEAETAYCIVLAAHMLSHLCMESDFTIDKQRQNKLDSVCCPCGCGVNLEDKLGDTSIGNESVWHGNPDIVLSSTCVCCLDDLGPCESSSSEEVGSNRPASSTSSPATFVGEKSRNTSSEHKSKSQLMAQCVVFSFLERKIQPNLKNTMIPVMGVCGPRVIFCLYDAEQDVMLESVAVHFLKEGAVSFEAILSIWMVVNYQVLGTGLAEIDQNTIGALPKANFYETAGAKVNVYKNELRFGHVASDNKRKRRLPDISELQSENLRASLQLRKAKEMFL